VESILTVTYMVCIFPCFFCKFTLILKPILLSSDDLDVSKS